MSFTKTTKQTVKGVALALGREIKRLTKERDDALAENARLRHALEPMEDFVRSQHGVRPLDPIMGEMFDAFEGQRMKRFK